MVVTTAKGGADDSLWEDFRNTIRTLYLTEDKSLEEVKNEMTTRYGFTATKSQFELHFKKWNFRKNLTSEEWSAVAHKIAKRKRDDKESEVYIDGLPMKLKKVKKAISRYRRTSSSQALSPQTPKGVTIFTPPLAPSTLQHRHTSPSPAFYPLTEHAFTLMSSIPFMQFGSIVNIEAHTRVGSPWIDDSTSVSNPHNFQASVVDHFRRGSIAEDLLGEFRRSLKALLPENVVHRHPTALQTTPTSPSSSESVNFLDLTLFMMSNKFLEPDSDISTGVYEWIKSHSSTGLLEYLLSMKGSTVEALAEQIFWLAIEMKDTATVKMILDSGLDPNELRCTSDTGKQITPLQRACEFRDLGLVRVLLDAGSDVNKFSANSSSPLAYAVAYFDSYGEIMDHVEIELVQILLHAGANVNPTPDSSPLLEAAAVAHVELVTVLLTAGADPNFSDRFEGSTPLMCAIRSDEDIADIIKIARQLLQAGADASDTSRDEGGEVSVLEHALYCNSTELIQMLLDAGAHITEPTLIGAVTSCALDTVKILLRCGARITQKVVEEAASSGETEVFWFLLDSTQDGVKEGSRSAALTAAIRHQREDLINALSASGVQLQSTSELTEAIEAAAERGDISVLRFLNDESPYRSSAIESLGGSLSCAVANRRSDVVDLLLGAGADVNMPKSGTNSTPLLKAILQRDAHLTKRLLAAGAAVNQTISDDLTKDRPFTTSVLPAAVFWGYSPCIRDIIDAGADVNAPESVTGKTALTVAIENDDFLTTQLLIASGADVNVSAASAIGYPALAASVRKSDINMVLYLLAFGAEADEQALIAAVPKSQELMQILLTARLTQCQRYPSGYGCRALQHAVARSNAGMIELLLSNGVDPNTIVRHQYGKNMAKEDSLPGPVSGYDSSALGVAIRLDKSQDLWIINMLLRGGANLNRIVSETANGQNALTAAVDEENLILVETLLKAGADVNSKVTGSRSRTPLQLAVEQGNLDIANVLLEHGADVNAPPCERYGATALQFAAIKGYLGIASVLVEKGADPNAAPAKVGGRTALEGAAEHGRIDMLQFLLNAGAQVIGVRTGQYERARKFASENGHIAARRLLEKHHSQQLDHQTPWYSLVTDIGIFEDIDFEGWGNMDLTMDDSVFGTLT